MRRVATADPAVDAIRRHDQVGVGKCGGFVQFPVKQQLHTERHGAALQDVQQMPALDAAEAMAAGRDHATLEVDVDIVPVGKALEDLLFGKRIRPFQVPQRFIGEHHAPTERVIGAVPLKHSDPVRRITSLIWIAKYKPPARRPRRRSVSVTSSSGRQIISEVICRRQAHGISHERPLIDARPLAEGAMLGPSAHLDTFTRDNLPPLDEWPEMLLEGFGIPSD